MLLLFYNHFFATGLLMGQRVWRSEDSLQDWVVPSIM